MKCIFCRNDASNSVSKEHIIPESLGNKDIILPAGIVCDECNNYFARKIEYELLKKEYFKNLRFRNAILSKKGKYPIEKGIILSHLIPVDIYREDRHTLSIGLNTSLEWAEKNLASGSLILPYPSFEKENDSITSRFLGKVGVEYLISLEYESNKSINGEFYHNKEMKELCGYVRYNRNNFIWPYNVRKIYKEKCLFHSKSIEFPFEVLHEITFLFTDEKELYLVLIIFGIEYVFNMGGPSIEGYLEWLKSNNNKSPVNTEFCTSYIRHQID